MCADFLEKNYDRVSFSDCCFKTDDPAGAHCSPQMSQVFTDYEKLLHSDNYVTKRQSLKVLPPALLNRSHSFICSFFNIYSFL